MVWPYIDGILIWDPGLALPNSGAKSSYDPTGFLVPGLEVGGSEGADVGAAVGVAVGAAVGAAVGSVAGASVGASVGLLVGLLVAIGFGSMQPSGHS